DEQVIQAQLRADRGQASQPSSSQGSSSGMSSLMPGIVACMQCGSRFAEGVKFCGRCGGRSFTVVSQGEGSFPCPRCGSPLAANSKFCGRCGNHLAVQQGAGATRPAGLFTGGQAPGMVERVCRRCGGVYPPNIKFCGRCGGSME